MWTMFWCAGVGAAETAHRGGTSVHAELLGIYEHQERRLDGAKRTLSLYLR